MNISKTFILIGLIFIITGIIIAILPKIPQIPKLPGDIYYRKENFTFYFPLTTSIILSIFLTLILNFIIKK